MISGFAESLINFRGTLIGALQSRGLSVNVASPDLLVSETAKDKLVAMGVQLHYIPLQRTATNPLADVRCFLALLRLMWRVRPNYVLCYTIKPVIYGTFAAWLAVVPHRYALITGLGYSFTGHPYGLRRIVKGLAQIMYRVALSRAHKVFFQNPDDEALFCELGILLAGTPSVVVNGSGVDVLGFSLTPLPSGPPRFLLIARLLGDKGIREFGQAAQRIKALHPQARFSLVGWIDENPDAIKQAELDAWVKQGSLDYLGRMEDVRPAIAACSVYVLPSYREGTPRTVLEAMAMGRPIITTDAPGCRETVIDGENGFLVPVKSVDALVAAMERFIEEPDLVVRMGKRSREIAEEKYDVHKVNDVMIREMGL